jgi:Protein of unknown function (DUF1364)
MMRRSPMKRATKPMKQGAGLSRGAPMKAKRKARPKIDGIDYLALCRGQDCYLRLAPMCASPDTVVPAHSNQGAHGKGMGIKASDIYTIPACHSCHALLDQGGKHSKEEKFAAWDAAFARWKEDRARILEQSL